jgi:DNA mismatch repair protein MutS2
MIYPRHFEQKSGFDRIREQLLKACLGEGGMQCIAAMQFETEAARLRQLLGAADEFGQILLSGKNFPAQDYYDLREDLRHLSIIGAVIETEQLGKLRASLRTITAITAFFEKDHAEAWPLLREMVSPVNFDPALLKRADAILDEKGDIRDNASPELFELRRSMESIKTQVEKKIRQVYLHLKKEGYTPDEAEITIRNGRSVIPLPAANKRVIRGFIHDESATGQTVYMEPEEIFELNNHVREVEAAERREIRKILAAYSDQLRPCIPDLMNAYAVLGNIDFTRAKALFARSINAVVPVIHEKPLMDFRQAVNPVLFLSGMQSGKKVIPLDISLDGENRILVISGPNAGGKSVCLKTAGLLQYMLQCGLPVPLRPDSEAGLFKHLFIEIGDEQSIENDLSTYSSHLRNIKILLEMADEGLLFLVDEFGSGTEPQLGGAIAEVVLERLVDKGCLGVVTTHYLNLKLLAGKLPGLINGAMLYDTRNMQPLYTLSIGKPGSSFALEIARKTGIPEDLLEQASLKTGKDVFDFEQQLQQLETDRKEMERRRLEFNIADELLSGLIRRYTDLSEKLEQQKKQILSKAAEDAAELLRLSNQKVEEAIRTIRENEAKKEVNLEVRQELKAFTEEEIKTFVERKTQMRPHSPSIKRRTKAGNTQKDEKPQTLASVKEGGFALLDGQNTVFEVEKIVGDTAHIFRDNIRLKVPLSRLTGCKGDKEAKRDLAGKMAMRKISTDINRKLGTFKSSIDVRGMRAEETLAFIQKYIDDALLLNVFEVRILHGKGNGVLRKLIREYLSGIPEVKQFRDENLESGGDGITVVYFR